MKKRLIPAAICILLAMLLFGCRTAQPEAQPTAPLAQTEAPPDEQMLLVGIWRNAGQYSEGHDFVETMTLDAGGICTIVLDYQGIPNYQTLTGVYTVENGMLLTTLEDESGSFDRDFRYTLDGDTLTLENGDKIVVYERIS